MEATTIAKNTWVNTWYDWYEPYVKDFCDDNELPIPEENSDEWWKAIYAMRDAEVDDFWANLKYSKYNDRNCIVTGSLGLWWGRPDIYPTYFDNLTDAIRACLKDADEYEVYSENGELNVVAYHHDGRNYFTVHVVKNDNDSLKKFHQFQNAIESGDTNCDISVFSERIEYLY